MYIEIEKRLGDLKLMETMMSDFLVRKNRRNAKSSAGFDFENDLCRIIPMNRSRSSCSVMAKHGRTDAPDEQRVQELIGFIEFVGFADLWIEGFFSFLYGRRTPGKGQFLLVTI